jgi:hypothetical protein
MFRLWWLQGVWREGVRRELEEARAAVEAKYTALLRLQVMKIYKLSQIGRLQVMKMSV